MAGTKPLILVVEDDGLLLTAIVKKLELEGFLVKGFGIGREALDWLKKEKRLPGVIWLDYYLKDMNGIAFVRELKQDERLVSIPVVVVSNSASLDNIYQMESLGVEKYLLKASYRLEDLIKIMREYIKE